MVTWASQSPVLQRRKSPFRYYPRCSCLSSSSRYLALGTALRHYIHSTLSFDISPKPFIMQSSIPLLLSLLLSLTSAFPPTDSMELVKRDVNASMPFSAPALLTGSAQTMTLTNIIQSLWNSSGVREHGVYKGISTDFPLFGNCNVRLPSVLNDTAAKDPSRIFGPGTPIPKPVYLPPVVLNIYMWSDEKYQWKSGQRCRDACLDLVFEAALRGDPSVQVDMWTGKPTDGMPGNSHCFAGYAEARQNGGINATECGS